MKRPAANRSTPRWREYYRASAKRPPRELLVQALNHIDWEGRPKGARTAIDIGSGAGTETMELLRRGWRVLAIDREAAAAEFLQGRVPTHLRSRLTTLVAPMEGLELPPADFVHASFSLPFCSPDLFPELWSTIRTAVRPGGHFAGQLFGDQDAWRGDRPMSFHSRRDIAVLTRGWKVEMLRETLEEGRSFAGGRRWSPKHWHFFDLILEKPRTRRTA